MARINLLPWREAARQQRKRDFTAALLAAALCTVAVGVLVQMHYSGLIEAQKARNERLTQETRALEEKIKTIERLEARKRDLIARMKIIQDLQESRPEIVRMFDALVSVMPEGVFLTSLNQTGGNVELEGRAQSNARVSALMRNIEAAGWIGRPRLLLIENKDQTGTGLSHFRLGFSQQRQTSPDEDGGQTADTATGAGARRG